MKKFIKNLIIFCVVPFLVVFGIDLWLRNMNSLYKEKINGLHKNSNSIEVLVLGNSHANYGVDPNEFKLNTYNLANVSQSLYFDKRLTLTNLNKLPKLKYVFISVDYHSLDFSSQNIRDIWSYYGNGIKYKDKSYLKEDISPFFFGYTPSVSVNLMKKSIIRKIKYRNKKVIDFDVEAGVLATDSINKGFIGYNGTSRYFDEKAMRSRAHKFDYPYNPKKRNEILSDLSDFIQKLKDKDVTPILFATPTFHQYNAFLDKRKIQRNQHDISYLCKKYGIEYWDYSDDIRLEKNDFYNCDHLNKVGAKKFSAILNKRLLEFSDQQKGKK